MDKGIYTALSGGIAKAHELELVANNLANAGTVGFKRDEGTFSEYLTELRHPDSVEGLKRQITAETMLDGRPQGDKSFVEMDGVYTNFQQGHLERTNRSLDMALEGKGFFEVLTPNGVRYTRQGNFSIDTEGKLVTVNGYPVLSAAGEVPIEQREDKLTADGKLVSSTTRKNPNAEFKARPGADRIINVGQAEGSIQINENGDVLRNGRRIATLSVQEFQEQQWLEKVGSSYYRNDRPENLSETSLSKVHQGFLEGSNVNPVQEMTRLIEVSRAYESHMQAIKTYQEIDGRSVNDLAGGR
jgi:flagellar basal-body rod protein FlgF